MIRVEILAAKVQMAEELAALLSSDERLEVVSARAVTRPFQYRRSVAADVLLLAGLRSDEYPMEGPPVVALSAKSSRNTPEAMAAHASLPMNADASEIVAAIIAAASGFYLFTRDQMPQPSPTRRNQDENSSAPAEKLTRRELEVLRMMADGLANKEIAGALGVSDHTAKFHVSQILAKLNVSSRTEAVRVGIRRGLLTI